MMVLTHCYPDSRDKLSGVWLHRAFSGFLEVLKISKWGFLNPFLYRKLWGKRLLACFVVPAGFIAWLASKDYILYCIGQECFWIERHWWFAWFCRPIFESASTVVYHSERVRRAITTTYGKYDGIVIHTPVNPKEFYPKC